MSTTIQSKLYRYKYKLALVLILLVHAFILTQLIFFPYQELFTYPYFINNGLLPYKQIWDQHFPGLMFLPINFGNLGMVNENIARVWAIGNVIIIQLLLFFISKRLLKSPKKALLVNFLYLLWQPFFEGWVLWIDSFLPLFLLPAFYFSYKAYEKNDNRSYILAGLFLGIGILFKQVVIPLAGLVGLALFAKAPDKKEITYFALGLIPVPTLMVIYLYLIGVFESFWYWTVTYNLTVFSELGRKYPTSSGALRVVSVFGASGLSIFSKQRSLVIWSVIFIIGSLASAYARFDFVHFQPALPFVVIASAIAFNFVWNYRNKLVRIVIGAYVAGSIILLANFYKGHVGDKVFFFDDETKLIARKIEEFTQPGERIFIFGSIPHLYQMSNTLPAGDIYVQQFSWFMAVSEEEILDSIVIEKPNFVLADRTVQVDGQYIVDYASQINRYLKENYTQVERVGTTEFLLRNEL